MQVSDHAPYRVVVVGAGYAGVIAANRILATLDRLRGPDRPAMPVELTMVNPRPEFVERIRLHEVAAGSRPSAVRPLSDVLHPAARLRLGAATRIDAAARVLHGDGWTLPYDSLVYAVGSRPATAVPGSAQHAVALGEVAAADRLRAQVAALPAGAVLAVVGGGLTGIEAASELAERHPQLEIHLVSGSQVAAGLSAGGSRRVRRSLQRLGVQVHEGAAVREVRPGRLEFADGGVLPFAVCAWAASMIAPELARDSGLAIDPLGRLLVDETLRQPEHPEIVGAGDAVAPPPSVAAHLRMSCAAALPLGAHAAGTVLATLGARGVVPGLRTARVAPLSLGYVIQCISLGRVDGVIQAVHRDDSPRRYSLGGRPAAVTKEQVCRSTIRTLRWERRRPLPVLSAPAPLPAPGAAPEVVPGVVPGDRSRERVRP